MRAKDLRFIARDLDLAEFEGLSEDWEVYKARTEGEFSVKAEVSREHGPNGWMTINVTGDYVHLKKFLADYLDEDDPEWFAENVEVLPGEWAGNVAVVTREAVENTVVTAMVNIGVTDDQVRATGYDGDLDDYVSGTWTDMIVMSKPKEA